jgi:excisionase family DNA binding protein
LWDVLKRVDKLLTIDELAQAFRVSTRTIYRMMGDGELPFAIKIKGSWRFREKDVAAWLESHQVGVSNGHH